ncbi:hypothetical protein NPA07_00080 [Mycoplasmopsis caviae]|uniref:Lipoprotein n=1 Tax=Mycoplasmopsis caviae TaxID=55603 RepID=A0ABY5J2P6_9BACT|nr:hypothetical protein [Mycoplasmopsis caviae]UUD35267.1 hypothetical protein NPA07_00080 [Mycoplasmopsis caviae]
MSLSLALPLVSCNCQSKQNNIKNINEYASNIEVSIPDENSKTIEDINSIDDFSFTNFDKTFYNLTEYKIEKNTINNSLTLTFKVRDIFGNLSKTQTKRFNNFKSKTKTNHAKEIDDSTQNVSFDVINKNTKKNNSIKSLNDFKIYNLNETKYSIYDLNITYPDSTSIKIYYTIKRNSDNKLGSRREQTINGFKNELTPNDAISSLRVSLVNANSTYEEINSKQLTAFSISSYDESKFKVSLDKLTKSGTLLTATFSLTSLLDSNKKVTKDFHFTLVVNLNPQDIDATKKMLNELANASKPILLVENEYADKIIANYESNHFFSFKNLNSSTTHKITKVEKVSDDKIKVHYTFQNLDNNVVSDEHSETITLKSKEETLKSYTDYIKQKDTNVPDYSDEYKDSQNREVHVHNYSNFDKYRDENSNIRSVFYGHKNYTSGLTNSSYTRTSQIGNDEAEIKELQDLVTKLNSDYSNLSYNLRSQYFNANNMTEALLNWYRDSWIDYIYTNVDLDTFDFPSEINWTDGIIKNKEKYKNRKFIKLYSMDKMDGPWHYPKLISNQSEKIKLYNFIKNGLAQIKRHMSDVDKLYAAERYVTDYLTYVMASMPTGIFKSIETKLGVCHHYGSLTALLLNFAGVQAFPYPIHNGVHQILAVNLRTKKHPDKPKWYFSDPTEVEEAVSGSLASGKYEYTRMPRWGTNSLLMDHNIYPDTIRASNFVLNHMLPWFKLSDPEYGGDNSFYKDSIFSTLEDRSNKMLTDNGIELVEKSSSGGLTRFFYHKDSWYTISSFKQNNKRKTGLFKFSLYDKKIKLVKDGDNIIDSNDEVAKIIELKDNYLYSLTFQENNFLYHYFGDNSTKKHYLKVYDLSKNSSQNVITKDITSELEPLNPSVSTIDFYVSDKNVVFYRYNQSLDDARGSDNPLKTNSDITKVIINDTQLTNIEEAKNNETLLNKLQLTRMLFGSFMYSDSKDWDIYLPLNARDEFNNLRKEIEAKTLESGFNLFDTNLYTSYADKIDQAYNKLLEIAYTKYDKVEIYKQIDLPSSININKQHLGDFGLKLNYKVGNYIHLKEKDNNMHMNYDVYFSETKPNNLNDESKIVLKNVTANDLFLRRELLQKSGYVWIKGYFALAKNKHLFSNIAQINVDSKWHWNDSIINDTNQGWYNVNVNLTSSNFNQPINLQTITSFSGDTSSIKSVKAKLYRIYKNQKTLINEQSFNTANNSSISHQIKPANIEPGCYYWEFVVTDNFGKHTFVNSNRYLSITENDSTNFDAQSYFNK